jgi:elongation factor G
MYHEETFGATYDDVAIPKDLVELAGKYRTQMLEAVSDVDDTLLEKYLEGEELSAQEIARGLHNGLMAGLFIPVFVASGLAEIGIAPLLDAFIDMMPSPAEVPPTVAEGKNGQEELFAKDSGPLAAYVWKTTADPFVGKITYLRYSGT